MRKKYDDAKELIMVPINEYELHSAEDEMHIVNLETRIFTRRDFNLEKASLQTFTCNSEV